MTPYLFPQSLGREDCVDQIWVRQANGIGAHPDSSSMFPMQFNVRILAFSSDNVPESPKIRVSRRNRPWKHFQRRQQVTPQRSRKSEGRPEEEYQNENTDK